MRARGGNATTPATSRITKLCTGLHEWRNVELGEQTAGAEAATKVRGARAARGEKRRVSAVLPTSGDLVCRTATPPPLHTLARESDVGGGSEKEFVYIPPERSLRRGPGGKPSWVKSAGSVAFFVISQRWGLGGLGGVERGAAGGLEDVGEGGDGGSPCEDRTVFPGRSTPTEHPLARLARPRAPLHGL